MDSFITALVLLVVSALATWFKQKAANSRNSNSPSGSSQTPPPANQPRPPVPRPTSWEDELRRLLEGQAPAAPPRPPPVRPPPMTRNVPPAPAPASPPPVVIRPVLVPPRRPAVITTQRPPPAPTPVPVPSAIEVSAGRLAPLKESREAYERASQLDKQVAQHIDRIPGQRVVNTSVTRREVSPEIAGVVSMFKNARAARQAVIASVILGPPRSLEEFAPSH